MTVTMKSSVKQFGSKSCLVLSHRWGHPHTEGHATNKMACDVIAPADVAASPPPNLAFIACKHCLAFGSVLTIFGVTVAQFEACALALSFIDGRQHLAALGGLAPILLPAHAHQFYNAISGS